MGDGVFNSADEAFATSKKYQINSGKLSRRDFLKVAAAGVEALAEWWIAHNIPLLKELWRENGFLITGNPDGINEIWSEVPPQLEGKKIPEHNEYFRRADDIFVQGIDQYNEWVKDDSNLPIPHYEKPDNFVDAPSLIANMGGEIDTIQDRWKNDDFYWYVGYGLDAIESYNQPYGMIMDGSSGGITNISDMIHLDPGTGFLQSLRDEMKSKYGDTFDVWEANRTNSLTEEQKLEVNNKFQKWYYSAREYVSNIRDKSKEPISTSILFSYFLYRNKGNILTSVWDTSVWLKIASRNDPKHDLHRDPTYERASELCHIFQDEFSPTVSANWVIDNVKPGDGLLNYTENPYDYPQYKDYMPPNRAGGYYHAWNIMALSLCVTPLALKRIVAAHSGPALEHNGKYSSEYGQVKTWADMLVVDKSDEILAHTRRYGHGH